MTEGWLDASSGASGDMLLGALLGAGVPLSVLQDAIDAVVPEPVSLSVSSTTRAGLAATRVHVEVADSSTHRTWRDIEPMLRDDRSRAVFGRLASAEAAVHGMSTADVHFHEVGALDAIADIVGVCAGFAHLGLDRLVCSPIALGGGTVTSAHGRLPVPAPAVVELLRGLPTYGGPVDVELTTPTGAALIAEWADGFGPQPAMTVSAVGVGAGGRDVAGHANVARVLLGEPTGSPAQQSPAGVRVLEANIDDMDPRLWPDVIAALLAAGASDAWLTPIVMKKGRPAHTLHVLCSAERRDAVAREVFRQTTTIGLREVPVGKQALDREMVSVEVGGQPVDVKLARLDGELLNLSPEYDHVVAAARALDRPVKEVLADAIAAARRLA